jgi:hypothetical protein
LPVGEIFAGQKPGMILNASGHEALLRRTARSLSPRARISAPPP